MTIAIAEREMELFGRMYGKGTVFTKHKSDENITASTQSKHNGMLGQQIIVLSILEITEQEFFQKVHELNSYPVN